MVYKLFTFFRKYLINNRKLIFNQIGFEIELEHLDKHIVQISREKITWPGAKIKKVYQVPYVFFKRFIY